MTVFLPDLEKQKREIDAKVATLQSRAISSGGLTDEAKQEIAALKKQSASLARDIEKARAKSYK